MHFLETFQAIRKRREMLQITQEALSEISGVSLRTLKQVESGKGNPTVKTMQKLAEALGLEIVLQVKTMTTNA